MALCCRPSLYQYRRGRRSLPPYTACPYHHSEEALAVTRCVPYVIPNGCRVHYHDTCTDVLRLPPGEACNRATSIGAALTTVACGPVYSTAPEMLLVSSGHMSWWDCRPWLVGLLCCKGAAVRSRPHVHSTALRVSCVDLECP